MQKIPKCTAAVINLWMSSTSISRKIDLRLGAIHGIGFTEYMVLFHLMNAPNNVQRRIDLADAIGRTASGVTRMLLPMEKIGLVTKESNPRDARVSLVKVTAAGEKVFHDASTTLNEESKHRLRRVDSQGINDLLEIFNAINEE